MTYGYIQRIIMTAKGIITAKRRKDRRTQGGREKMKEREGEVGKS